MKSVNAGIRLYCGFGRALVLTLILILTTRIPAHAQTEIIPKEVAALFEDISDIDKLRVLNPLKLTLSQLDKTIAAVKKAQTDYNKKLAEAAVPPIKELAKEIKDTRQKMLTSGGGVPKDFDEKVKKVQADYVKRRGAEDQHTLKELADTLRDILTKDQQATAVQIAKKFSEEDGKPTKKGTDDQFFNLYVLGTFIVYGRIVTVLEDMRKAAGGAVSGTMGSHPKSASLDTSHTLPAISGRTIALSNAPLNRRR